MTILTIHKKIMQVGEKPSYIARKYNSLTFVLMLLIILLIQSTMQEAFAKDFGKQGNSFTIKEEGFIAMIKRKLQNLDLNALSKEMQKTAKKQVEEPSPIQGITRAIKTISHSFDPSYILDEDIILPSGNILYARGTKVNPLDHVTWDSKIIFIDSRDEDQVAFIAMHYISTNSADTTDTTNKIAPHQSTSTTDVQSTSEAEESYVKSVKIVLVSGSPVALERQIKIPVYFDQFGELTKKFNISHVPAVVEQNGKYLKVTEIAIPQHISTKRTTNNQAQT